MNFGDIVGQTLDDKYRIEKELGRGGMGAVYLSTHIGTNAPSRLKLLCLDLCGAADFIYLNLNLPPIA